VVSAVVMYTNNDNVPRTVTLTEARPDVWTGNGLNARNGSNYRVVAKDNLGATSTLAFTPDPICFS
jgi:hypothetical protein